MNKLFFLIFILNLSVSYSQNIDSLLTKINNDSTAVVDTSSGTDSLMAVADSLKKERLRLPKPILLKGYLIPADSASVITHREIIYNEYQYTGDYFNVFPLAYQRDLGFLGQPNEIMIYGSGYNETSYLQNGIFLNNRITNSIDLNNYQSESVDSIEIIPSPRGFLYGAFNNPVSVNFISREQFVPDSVRLPYSRMRYFQAPDDAAMIDAIYRNYFFRRIIGLFEITNKTAADRFPNTSYGGWKVNADLKYLLSDNFNLSAVYGYVKTTTSLFGGVDVDSLKNIPADFPAQNSDAAKPVNFPNRYQKLTEHNFFLKLANNNFNSLSGETGLYYRFNLSEFRQNEDSSSSQIEVIRDNNKYKVYGGYTNQRFNNDYMNLNMSANYEVTDTKASMLFNNKVFNTSAISGRLSFRLLDDHFIPSFFAKYLYFNSHSYTGFGADANLTLFRSINLYGGLSEFTQPLNLLEDQYSILDTSLIPALNTNITSKKIRSVELGAGFSYGNLKSNIQLFYRNTKNYLSPVILENTARVVDFLPGTHNVSGAGVELKFHIWQIFVDTYSAYYNSTLNSKTEYTIPDYTLKGKLYYQDTLFNANLFLRTGFKAQYIGRQDFYSYDFEKSMSAQYFFTNQNGIYQQNITVSPSFQLDFFLIGEIRRRAILYFEFENILNNEYYVVPFYYKQPFGYRLGVAWEFIN